MPRVSFVVRCAEILPVFLVPETSWIIMKQCFVSYRSCTRGNKEQRDHQFLISRNGCANPRVRPTCLAGIDTLYGEEVWVPSEESDIQGNLFDWKLGIKATRRYHRIYFRNGESAPRFDKFTNFDLVTSLTMEWCHLHVWCARGAPQRAELSAANLRVAARSERARMFGGFVVCVDVLLPRHRVKVDGNAPKETG